MTRRIPILLAVTAAAGLGACGGDGGSTGSGQQAGDHREAALQYARCMRENGIDMPDPKTDENGVVLAEGNDGPNGGGASARRYGEADERCREHLDDAKPPRLSDEQQEEFRQQALAHAKCMREHGVANFPDPSVTEDGGAVVNIGPDSGLHLDSPAFKRAQEACRSLMGGPGGGS